MEKGDCSTGEAELCWEASGCSFPPKVPHRPSGSLDLISRAAQDCINKVSGCNCVDAKLERLDLSFFFLLQNWQRKTD